MNEEDMAGSPFLISLGLPVFNGENFIEQALQSIQAQTFLHFELIVTDNASTDRTQAIVEAYAQKDERIRYYRNRENLGAAANYNLAFFHARGDYFKWVSHDDMIAPTFLESCLSVLQQNSDVVLSYPHTVIIDQNGRETDRYADGLHLRQPRAHQRLRYFFDNPGLCHPVFGLMRREVLAKTGLIGNFPRSDRNLIGEMALYGHLYEIPEPLFLRRIHAQTSTRVHRTEQELAVWFDPKKQGTRTFPRWRRLIEYMKAIARAPLNGRERIACYLVISRFLLVPDRLRGILDDMRLSTSIPTD